jgi:hypothetical protein
MLILRGGGTMLLDPIIGAFPDRPGRMAAIALRTGLSAVPRPRFIRHVPTAEVSSHA